MDEPELPDITVHYPMGEELTKRYHAAVSNRLDEQFGSPGAVWAEMLRLEGLVNDMLTRRDEVEHRQAP